MEDIEKVQKRQDAKERICLDWRNKRSIHQSEGRGLVRQKEEERKTEERKTRIIPRFAPFFHPNLEGC